MANSEVLNQAEAETAKSVPPRPAPPRPVPPRPAAPRATARPSQPTAAQPVPARTISRSAPPPPVPKPASKRPAPFGDDPDDLETKSRWNFGFLRVVFSAYFVSLVLHAGILVLLWVIAVPPEVKEEIYSVLVTQTEAIEEEVVIEQLDQPLEIHDFEEDFNPAELPVLTDEVSKTDDPITFDRNELETMFAPESTDATGPPIDKITTITQGRSQASRSQMLAERGGNAASDSAVVSGLDWIQSVQRRDGSWSFADIGKSSQPGTLKNCTNGATALALMAFLGAGHTHQGESKYQQTVDRGLGYLLRHYRPTPDGFDFRGQVVANEGMYVQGLVGIALSEAYGLTKDRRLRQAAEGCLLFIMRAQDPKGGGWRYSPRQPGDTSVVGWELMALKSGYYADIPIPRNVVAGCSHFLDTVAAEGGSKYGYTGPQPKASTTAIGLLCRMYLGWQKDHPALIEGVKYLSSVGPAKNDMYYNYYATQTLIQFTNARGEMWQKWNTAMRNRLVSTQKKTGPEKGSWDLADAHGGSGGRLYMTSLCVMTLEVYYRVLPLYKQDAVKEKL